MFDIKQAFYRNQPWRRPCGCPIRRLSELPWNLLTLVKAWAHGRSYANFDGFLDPEWEPEYDLTDEDVEAIWADYDEQGVYDWNDPEFMDAFLEAHGAQSDEDMRYEYVADLADRSVFFLDDENWDQFNAMLDREPVYNERLAALMNTPTILEADPELEALLREEEEIERQIRDANK